MTPRKSTGRKKLGRPEHAPTSAMRRDVSIWAGGGMLHEHIALALGISRETLRKYYLEELTVGAVQRRAQVMKAQFTAATKKGSTTAARAYLGGQPEVESPPQGSEDQPAPAVAGPRPAKLGKKEQAAIDAHSAADGTDWSDLLPKPGTPLQ